MSVQIFLGPKPTQPTGSFLKWVGSKKYLVEDSASFMLPMPKEGCVYREPFLGGGSVYFGKYYDMCAVLSDVNDRLINVYRVVRDRVEDLILELAKHPYNEEHFYKVRSLMNLNSGSEIEQAAYFMVSNKYGYNGLYRVNKRNEVNVPFGKYTNPTLCNEERLRACSSVLRSRSGTTIRSLDYKDHLMEAQRGDAVFLDSPYVPASKTANFVGYDKNGFGPADQKLLVELLHVLDERGVRWALTNSDTEETRLMYAGWSTFSLRAKRKLNCDAKKRGPVGEILVLGRNE